MREEILTIEKMAYGGAGVGRLDGKVFFVPFAAVGDKLKVRVKSERKSYAEGEIVEVLDKSTFRADPPCPVFGQCGGCDWQHLMYEEQLRRKEQIFGETLWRAARIEPDRILPVIASEKQYGYRSRAQIKLRYAEGKLHSGFFRAGSHYVIDLPGRCAVMDEAINRLCGQFCELMSEFPEPSKVPQIDITVGDDGEAVVIVHYIGERRDAAVEHLARQVKVRTGATGLFVQCGRKDTILKVFGCESTCYKIPGSIHPGLPDMSLRTGRGGFSQVNLLQNVTLISTLLSWLQPVGNETVLDLFCGNGNFSLPLARLTSRVIGMEAYEPAVQDADLNAASNGIGNASFEGIDAAEGVMKLLGVNEHVDFVVLDPPRTGAAAVVKLIPELRASKIVYVSCDPPTLGRDLAELGKRGYLVVKSQPIDMFPQTYHLESITLLERVSR